MQTVPSAAADAGNCWEAVVERNAQVALDLRGSVSESAAVSGVCRDGHGEVVVAVEDEAVAAVDECVAVEDYR